MQPERLHCNLDVAARRERAAKVMATLQFVTKRDAHQFESTQYDSDESSDLPDPFSDDSDEDEQANEIAARRKRCSSHEVNQYLMSCFSAEHKRAEAEYHLRYGHPAQDANPDARRHLMVVGSKAPVVESAEFTAQIDGLLAQTGLTVYLRQQEEERKALAKKRKP